MCASCRRLLVRRAVPAIKVLWQLIKNLNYSLPVIEVHRGRHCNINYSTCVAGKHGIGNDTHTQAIRTEHNLAAIGTESLLELFLWMAEGPHFGGLHLN